MTVNAGHLLSSLEIRHQASSSDGEIDSDHLDMATPLFNERILRVLCMH